MAMSDYPSPFLRDLEDNSYMEPHMAESKVTTIPEFNPTGNEIVAEIKRRTEELISYIQSVSGLDERRKAIALTNYEQAAMWAVKACFP